MAALIVTGGVAGFATGVFHTGSAGPAAGSATSAGSAPSAGASSAVEPTAGAPRSATRIGEAFLADWVTDGRVIRRDQGGDTVSEGQAYGMLISVGVGDETSFQAIWSWTQKNLQRPDGLLAWRYAGGKVADEQPAADADVDAARALILAGKKFDDESYTKAGVKLAGAIADELTATTPDGRILLPGLWAQGSGPWSYNPSYAAPQTFEQLATATNDPRWTQLAEGSRAVTSKILAATALPSDWMQVKTDGSVVPLPNATGSVTGTGDANTVQYGYDAGRLPVRFADSCQAADVALAAKLAAPLGGKDPLPMQLDLGGTALNADQSPLGYVARAAAEAANGQQTAAQADLASADRLAQSTPTYYGAAWDALGALQLENNAFGGCTPLKGR